VFHSCRDLHFKLLIHFAAQFVAEEDHDEGSRSEQQHEHQYVKKPSNDDPDGRFRLDRSASTLLLQAQLSADEAPQLVLISELKLLVVEDHCRIMAYLGVFGSIKCKALINSEIVLVALLLARRQKEIHFGCDARSVNLQIVH
jgi:hypothetical protein